jgi:hypothetical protein
MKKQIVVRNHRRRRRCIILLTALAVTAARAELDDIDDVIAQCARHEVKDERITCLESELRRIADRAETVAAERGALPRHAADEDPVKAPEATTPQVVVSGEASPPAIPEATAPPAARTDESQAATRKELGSEQVARRNEARPDVEGGVSATVVAFDVVGYRKLLLELDNGQIWRQTNGDRADVAWDLRDERNFDVELRRSGLGGYRMYLAPIDRTIRVERVK